MKLLLISILAFLWGIFISIRTEPFQKLILSFVVIIILLTYKSFIALKKRKKRELKSYLKFGGIGVIFFILGFIIGFTTIPKFEGPVYGLVTFSFMMFLAFSIMLYYSRDYPTKFFDYFIGIFSLFFGIFMVFGTISDYSKGNLTYPYNFIMPIISLGFLILGIIGLRMGIKKK